MKDGEYKAWLSVDKGDRGFYFESKGVDVVVPIHEFFKDSLVGLTPSMAKKYSEDLKWFSRELRRFSEGSGENHIDPDRTCFDEFQEELSVLLDEYSVSMKTEIHYYETSTVFSDKVSGQCCEIDKDGNPL